MTKQEKLLMLLGGEEWTSSKEIQRAYGPGWRGALARLKRLGHPIKAQQAGSGRGKEYRLASDPPAPAAKKAPKSTLNGHTIPFAAELLGLTVGEFVEKASHAHAEQVFARAKAVLTAEAVVLTSGERSLLGRG